MSALNGLHQPLRLRRSSPLRANRWQAVPVLIAVGVVAAAWLIAVALGASPRSATFAPDVAWWSLMQTAHVPPVTRIADALNLVGGGWTSVRVTAAVVGALILLRGWRAGMFVAVCSWISTVDVDALKSVAGRLRPPDELVAATGGSFPSGHTANAAVLVVACALVLRRRWVWLPAVLYILVMAVSRTYLDVHWASDTVVGGLEGAAVATAVWFSLPARFSALGRDTRAI